MVRVERTRTTTVALLVLLAPATLFLLAAAVTALAPGTDLFGAEPSKRLVVVWGPLLVLLGVAVTVTAWLVRRRALTTAVAVAATVATLVLAGAVGAVVTATLSAGGSVDPWRALTLAGPPEGSAPDARTVYTTTPQGQDLHLAIYRPARTDPAPVMVWVHGGGWAAGSELDRAADMRRLADAGFLAISVEYTLAEPGRPTWDVAGPQVACALTRVAERAAEQGGDPRRIVLGGDSAGGQLAVSVGYGAAAGTQPSACASPVPVPRPRAIATIYPAVDLADTYRRGQGAQRFAVGYTGGTPDEVPDRYRAVTGVHALGPEAPPTFAVVPARDHLVPPEGATRFLEAARAAGVDTAQADIPFADHAFDTGPDGSLGHQAAFSTLEHWVTAQVG